MEPINIILIFLVIIVIFLVIYLIMTFLLKSTDKIQEIKKTMEIPTPPIINIKKEECQQTLVLDYDEIDFNEIKKS